MIMGDFNIDLLKYDSYAGSENVINTLGSFFFQTQILQPTRITDHSSTLIDNIFFNSVEHFVISGNLVYDLTDNLPNFVIFNKFSSLPPGVKIYKRDYSKFEETDLVTEMQAVNWETIFTSNCNSSSMFDSFYDKTSEIIDKHIPIKQISRGELKFKSKPWITPAIKVSIQMKNNLYKKYLKTKSTYYHIKFKCYRNKINHLLKISKRQYYNSYFLENINDSKIIWSGIKEIIHFKPKTNQKTIQIVEDNVEITDPKIIANAFNNYFTNIGNNLANLIPKVPNSPLENLKSPLPNSFFIFPATTNEIETEISQLKTGKAACWSF
jgi:hypothetical protein